MSTEWDAQQAAVDLLKRARFPRDASSSADLYEEVWRVMSEVSVGRGVDGLADLTYWLATHFSRLAESHERCCPGRVAELLTNAQVSIDEDRMEEER